MQDQLIRIVHRVGAIGDKSTDTEEEQLRHRFLVWMGVLMCGGGIMWGTISASYGMYLAAVFPYGYVVLTVLNLTAFNATKNFTVARLVQVSISLLLPFIFQWSLGGFVASGAVMLWAMLAIVGSLTFGSARDSLRWLFVYLMLTIVSGLLDAKVEALFSAQPSSAASIAFLVTNIAVISGIVFGLTIYLMDKTEEAKLALVGANNTITELNEKLEDDVEERTRQLASSFAQSQAILTNLADGLVAVDREGKVTSSNPAFSELLFMDDEAMRSDPTTALPAELAELAALAMDVDEVIRREFPLPGDRTGAAVASPIRDDAAMGAVVILRDVTLEKEIDRMKTDFIATVSHELRTPLTSVLGFAKLTRNKLRSAVFPHVPLDDRKGQRAVKQVGNNVDIILAEGERLTALITDVLDISKMEAGQMEWKMGDVDPAELVRRSAEATSSLFRGDVPLAVDLDPSLPMIAGDQDRLMQVVINLISNAAKFTDAGSVTLAAREVSTGVEISVTDTGDGIDVTQHDSVFQKFKQVGDTLTDRPQGTGLGLPICRQIVTAHHGTIWVKSELGKGARFAFTIPLSGANQPSSPIEALLHRIDLQVDQEESIENAEILVVDDDQSLREMLRQQLGERGYVVRLATDGREGLAAIREKRPDLVVLDVMMPGLTGFDVTRALKTDPATKDIPIIILSVVQDAVQGYRLGVDKYLTKPMDVERLHQSVQRVLRTRRSLTKVLVVHNGDASATRAALEVKSFKVVGTCTVADCLPNAKELRPDLILVDAPEGESIALLQSLRQDPELHDVHVVSLVDEPPAAPTA